MESPVKDEEKILNQSREESPEITKDNFEEDAIENDDSPNQRNQVKIELKLEVSKTVKTPLKQEVEEKQSLEVNKQF